MSRNEDYLDNLLTSVTDRLSEFDDDFEQNRESLKQSYQTQSNLPPKTQSALNEIREDHFLSDFEQELQSDGLDDDFMREFEREMNSGSGDASDLSDFMQDSASSNLFDDLQQTESIAKPLPPDGAGDGYSALQTGDLSDLDVLPPNDMAGFDTPQTDGRSLDSDEITQLLDSPQQTAGPAEADQMVPDTMSQEELDRLFHNPEENNTDISGNTQNAPAQDDFLSQISEEMQESFPEEMQELGLDDTGAAASVQQTGSGQEETMGAPEGMEGLEDIFGDLLDGETGSTQSVDSGLNADPEPADEEAFSEITRMLNEDENSADAGAADPLAKAGGPDFSFEESDVSQKERSGKKKKKEKNANGPFAKLSRILFGTPEELDPEAAAAYAAANPQSNADPKEIKEKKKKEKELKKQQKKEEAEEKKKEKEAAKAEKEAKKASKPKKEKKPKPAKSKKPKEPPLPKVPVAMMWIAALSIMVLVFLGTSLTGYTSAVSASKEAFDKGDYVTAYTKLQGVKVRKADNELYQAASALAGVQVQLDAYTALMEQKQYEMALDALVRGYGRCAIHSAQAEEWGVSKQLTQFENQLDQLLKEQFNVSKRKAKKLYQIKRRTEYTLELQEILQKLGLEQK